MLQFSRTANGGDTGEQRCTGPGNQRDTNTSITDLQVNLKRGGLIFLRVSDQILNHPHSV